MRAHFLGKFLTSSCMCIFFFKKNKIMARFNSGRTRRVLLLTIGHVVIELNVKIGKHVIIEKTRNVVDLVFCDIQNTNLEQT